MLVWDEGCCSMRKWVVGGTCLQSGCRNVGQEDFCILSCLLADLFHHKVLNFLFRGEFRDLPEGLCLSGIQMLPCDPFSAPFHTCSISPAVPLLALLTRQGCLIIPHDSSKNAWIYGSPAVENLLWGMSSHFRYWARFLWRSVQMCRRASCRPTGPTMEVCPLALPFS